MVILCHMTFSPKKQSKSDHNAALNKVGKCFPSQQWPVRHLGLGSRPVWVLGKPCTPGQRSGSWPQLCSLFLPPLNTAAPFWAGVPNLQDLMPHDLRWGWCNNNWNKVHNTCRRRQWHPTPVLLPGKSHGLRSLVGCSPWGREEMDTTEQLHFHFSLSCIGEGNGNPLQCSCLENPRDTGAWWAAVYGVTESDTTEAT